MNTTTKTITAAALVLTIIGIGFAVITAQPPTTVRSVPPAPQGEWVALTESDANNAVSKNIKYSRSQGGYEYAVLFHTGTGKARIVKWSSLDAITVIESN